MQINFAQHSILVAYIIMYFILTHAVPFAQTSDFVGLHVRKEMKIDSRSS
jgi:hypothetical protein